VGVAPPPAQQATTRHARRIYIGGLPSGMSEAVMTHFFNSMMMATGAATQPGMPVVSVYLNHEKVGGRGAGAAGAAAL
jgi:hypothetical protein